MHFELEHVDVGWPGGAVLVGDVTVEVGAGDMIRIAGASGCGKSTFLRLFNRLLDPVRGNIWADGIPLDEWPVQDLRRQVAYLQQEPVTIEGTVRDNLLLPFALSTVRRSHERVPGDDDLLRHLKHFHLQSVALEDVASKLSTGQRQRLALIRLLLMQPSALLVDEPVSALDEESRRIVMQAINAANREQGTTVIYVSHLDWHEADETHRVFQINAETSSLQELRGIAR